LAAAAFQLFDLLAVEILWILAIARICSFMWHTHWTLLLTTLCPFGSFAILDSQFHRCPAFTALHPLGRNTKIVTIWKCGKLCV